MSIFTGIAYVLALMTIFLGVTLHESDIKNNDERNIFNYTELQFDLWNSSQWETSKINATNINMTEAFTHRFKNTIYKAIDLIGYSFVQGIKLGIEFGYEKAYNYEPDDFISFAKWILIVIVIIAIIPAIVPVLAFLYLLFIGFKWLIEKIKSN